MKINKTNAMRVLDKAKIEYNVLTYDTDDGFIDGARVAQKCNRESKMVFKTLITHTPTKEYYVFMVPVDKELNLKLCAKSVNEKSIEMIHVNEITAISGYVRGGCSPIAMKKQYKTIIDESALENDLILFSGGKIGIQIELNPLSLAKVIHAEFSELTN